jgi:signal transduction histidine kinase
MKRDDSSRVSVLTLLKNSATSRRSLLEHAWQFVGDAPAAALLWLVDSERGDLVLDTCSSNVAKDESPLFGITVTPRARAATTSDNPPAWRLGLEHQRQLRVWAEAHGFDNHDFSLPVKTELGSEEHVIAFLQILSHLPVLDDAIEEIGAVCDAMAILIARSRESRKLRAIQTIAQEWSERMTRQQWLSSVAETICKTIGAEACLVFRDSAVGFQAAATFPHHQQPFPASEKSAIKVILRDPLNHRNVRLRDWDSDEERLAVFGTLQHDEDQHRDVAQRLIPMKRIRSVMMSPVIFEQQALAVIVVINKDARVHIAGVFSKTDMEVLSMVSDYVAGVLPTREMYRAVTKLGEIVAPGALSDERERAKLFDVLFDVIPGVTGAALMRKRRGSVAMQLDVLGGHLSTVDPAVLRARVDRVYELEPSRLAAGRATHGYTSRIRDPNLVQEAYLAIELTKSALGPYEEKLLGFVSRELTHLLLTEQGLDDVTAQFVQLRHAVRSGLTGAIGYLGEALGWYERYRKASFAITELERGRLHKSLHRANLSARKTGYLLDESRVLLGSLTRATIQLHAHAINDLVSRTLDTLRPLADVRHVQLNFDRTMPADSYTVVCDRSLVEMLLFNVLDNAIKYSHRARTVYVRLTRTRSDWQLEVTNFGTHIQSEDRELIFEPFVRRPAGESGFTRPGTGLGLAVAKEITKVHNGTIECRSEVREGAMAETTFTIRLPRNLSQDSR